MKKYILYLLLVIFIQSCVYEKKFKSELPGKSVVTTKKLLLYNSDTKRPYMHDYTYDLYDYSYEDAWRKNGWINLGTKMNIHSVSTYMIDGRGEVVYILGDVNGKKFNYWWRYDTQMKKMSDLPFRSDW